MDSVDFSQRTAGDPEDDEASRTAEQTIKMLRELTPDWYRLHDPEELAKLKQELRRDALGPRIEKQPQEPEEEKFSSDKFWNSEEPKKQIPRKL